MSAASSTRSRQRAGRREWAALAVLVMPALLISMDLSVLYLAVPHLSADLRPSSTQLLWVTDIYGFLLAGFLITMGTLGDRIGRRRLLMIGAAAFGIASVAAAYASSAEMLITARALLGIAGATLGPSTLALISNVFRDDRQRSIAIAVWATGLSVGGALGPVVGGSLLEWYWWGSVFLIAVPVMALLLVSAPVLLPEYRDGDAGKLDLTSVILSLATVLPVIYGLKQAAQGGGWTAAVPIVVGLVAGQVFVRRQRALDDPLIDLRLFRHRALSTALVVNMAAFFVVLGLGLYFAQYLQLVLGVSPLQAGLATVPMFVGFIGGAMVSPLIINRVRPVFIMTTGFGVGAAGAAILAFVEADSGIATLITGSVILAAGIGPVLPLVTNVVLRSAPPEKAGAASGLVETSTEFGGALGIAALGVVGTAVYRSMMGTTPPDVSAESAAAAGDTLGGAVAVADGLPTGLAAQLLAAAREAFTSALAAAAVVSVVVLVAVAIAVAVQRNIGAEA